MYNYLYSVVAQYVEAVHDVSMINVDRVVQILHRNISKLVRDVSNHTVDYNPERIMYLS